MKSTVKRMICRFMVIALMMVPFHTGQAKMIGMDQVTPPSTAQVDRALILNHLSRSQVASEFQTLGLDAQSAKDRVAAMTDAEVSSLAGKIHAAPAGADGAVALILVVFFIWYFAFRR